jgi:hypothetical protein
MTGSKAGVAVARNLDLHRSDLGQHRLDAGAVAGVAAIAPDRVMALIAQMLAHLRFQGGLKHRLGQPGQQAARADELHPLRPGGLNKLLGELLLKIRSGTTSMVMADPSPELRSACRTSYTVCRTVPSDNAAPAREVADQRKRVLHGEELADFAPRSIFKSAPPSPSVS